MSELNNKPLVTFALFAYNQEKYIRKAIEGAFAQDYSPLEIILSDDCSTDRTFEIMQEMASKYNGPHVVIVRRSPVNYGLGLHIQDVATVALGTYIVVAAGDDFSLPQRTSELVQLMVEEGTNFAASCFNKMNENGTILEFNVQNDYSENYVWKIIDADHSHFANGATAAYKSEFLRSAFQAAIKTIKSGYLYNEDILIAAYAAAINVKPSSYKMAALINYRINLSSLSNYAKRNDSIKEELSLIRRELFYSATRLATLSAISEIAAIHPNIVSRLNAQKIEFDKRLSNIELAASDTKFVVRFQSLFMVKSPGEFSICFSRLFGIRLLAYTRFIRRKFVNL